MANVRWKEPVKVGLGFVGTRTVNGAMDALVCLNEYWPRRRGSSFDIALRSCRGALTGAIDIEIARRHFLEAVDEAHIIRH